jgi:hypothetical protein
VGLSNAEVARTVDKHGNRAGPADRVRVPRAPCERAGVQDKALLEDSVLDVAVLKDEAAVRTYAGNRAIQGTGVKPVYGEPE